MNTYIAAHSLDPKGWCIFKRVNNMIYSFFAGPFGNEGDAESEAKRLCKQR